MNSKIIITLLSISLASCGGLRTFHDYARAGDTIAVPIGMQPDFNKDDYATQPLPFHHFIHNFNEQHRHLDLTYLLRSYTDELEPNPDESQEIEWFNPSEIDELYKEGFIFDNVHSTCSWIFDRYDTL